MTAAEELDVQLLAHVAARPGSTVWDLTGMFPAIPVPSPAAGELFGLPAPNPRTVPSVTPAQIVAALARLRRAGLVMCTRDAGIGGAERWQAAT